jgi:hypothetical protein
MNNLERPLDKFTLQFIETLLTEDLNRLTSDPDELPDETEELMIRRFRDKIRDLISM